MYNKITICFDNSSCHIKKINIIKFDYVIYNGSSKRNIKDMDDFILQFRRHFRDSDGKMFIESFYFDRKYFKSKKEIIEGIKDFERRFFNNRKSIFE